jgi:hypothetical protein
MRQFKPLSIPTYNPADKAFTKWRRARQTTRKEWWRRYHVELQREERRQEAWARNRPRRERAEAKRVAQEQAWALEAIQRKAEQARLEAIKTRPVLTVVQ